MDLFIHNLLARSYASSPGKPAADRKCVLIADDDFEVLAALAAVLEFEGYEVEVAQDGPQAMRRARANPPDLLLLDLNMPKADGWTTFAEFDQAFPLVPVIIITARPNQYQEAVRLGVDAFMEKPLDFPVLLQAVGKLTHEAERRHTQRNTDREFVTWLLQPGPSNH